MSSTTPSPFVEARPASVEPPGAVALQYLFRLAKLSSMHAMDNQAIRQTLPQLVASLQAACAEHGHLTVTFAGEAVWLNGKLLKAARQAYDVCQQVGKMIEQVGFNHLRVEAGVAEGDVAGLLARLGGPPGRDPGQEGAISLRRVEVRLPTAMSGDDVPVEQSVRLYTSGVVLTQRLLEDVREGRYELLRHVKRMAHRLVLRAMGSPDSLRQILLLRVARREEASRAMHTALLALLATLELTDDRRVLLRVVTSALAMDLGRPRAAGLTGATRAQQLRLAMELSEAQKDRLPEATAYVFLGVGSQTAEALSRSTVLYEAHALRRRETLGEPHGGRWPIPFEATLLSTTRALVDTVANAALTLPIGLSQGASLLRMKLATPFEQECLSLVLRGAEIIPEGATVQLESGWFARVEACSDNPALQRRPRVTLLQGPSGEAGSPEPVDLATPGIHGAVARVLSSAWT